MNDEIKNRMLKAELFIICILFILILILIIILKKKRMHKYKTGSILSFTAKSLKYGNIRLEKKFKNHILNILN